MEKKISKVLVDGREFFSSDIKIATKNLSTELVDKVQVLDTKTLQQLYGEISKSDNKTINIKLKMGIVTLSAMKMGEFFI